MIGNILEKPNYETRVDTRSCVYERRIVETVWYTETWFGLIRKRREVIFSEKYLIVDNVAYRRAKERAEALISILEAQDGKE